MNSRKRIITIVLASLIITGSVPMKGTCTYVNAQQTSSETQVSNAIGGQCGKQAFWSFDEKTGQFTVSGSGNMYNYSTDPTAWQSIKEEIKTVKISDQIKTIGSWTFSDCVNLTSVEYTDSIYQICDNAFAGCVNLKDFRISDSIRYICKDAFKDCKLTSEYENSVQYVDNWAVGTDGKEITSVELRENTVGIAAHSFEGLGELKKVTMPDSLKFINTYAFDSCESLESVKLSENLSIIEDYAFENCMSLKEITIPDSTSHIGTGAFCQCTGLTQVVLPFTAGGVGDSVFKGCTSLTEVRLPDCCTRIGNEAFSGCTSLEDINVPFTVTNILKTAFDGHNDKFTIHSVDGSYAQEFAQENDIEFSGEEIYEGRCGENQQWKFDSESGTLTVSGTGETNSLSPWSYLNDKIEKINIEDGITSIERYSFKDCSNLKSVVMADSVRGIYYEAFSGCSELSDLVLSDNISYISGYAFEGCDKVFTTDENGLVFIKDWLVDHDDQFSVEELIIDGSVKGIADGALLDCQSLKSVKINDGVRYIDDGAFHYCENLSQVDIPDSVEKIGNDAFQDCKKLEKINIPDSVTTVYGETFQFCSELSEVTFTSSIGSIPDRMFHSCTKLEKIVIPQGITSIGAQAFADCDNLAEISVPDSVTDIADDAFLFHNEKLIIKGVKGSYAQKYAADNNISFSEEGSEPLNIKYGDLDLNGTVELNDLTALSLHIIGDKKLPEERLKAADVNDDGGVDLADLAMIKQYLSMDDVVLGPQK